MEPREKMRVDVQSILFEETGKIMESNAHESLTFIANEYLIHKEPDSSDVNQSDTRVYYQFIIESSNSDSTVESIFTFWSMSIKKFVYLVKTSGKVKLSLSREVNKGIITMDFLNPGAAQLFWYYGSKMRLRKKVN